MNKQTSQFLLYQTENGQTNIDVLVEGDTVWLSQGQMCDLFQRDKSVISRHINNVFREGELEQNSVVAYFATTASDGKSYKIKYYNLDVIISVGYRVKSHIGTQFRIWATKRLREYIVKGFTMNDDLLKKAGGGNYFDELLERIRDIRSSEKVFWRKILEIYATSVDYDSKSESSIDFFKTVQNKMHWAAHGHTAAEIVYERANAELINMGMTSFKGKRITKAESKIAKNYLNKDELNILNRLVNAYLEFAELQAIQGNVMHMKDWIERLDAFIQMTDSNILTHYGNISHADAIAKSEIEYRKYKKEQINEVSEVEKHFISSIDNTIKKLKGK